MATTEAGRAALHSADAGSVLRTSLGGGEARHGSYSSGGTLAAGDEVREHLASAVRLLEAGGPVIAVATAPAPPPAAAAAAAAVAAAASPGSGSAGSTAPVESSVG
jgi:hypothetical protein